jgi:N-acetylglucosamine-6-phosphate deacetylase
MCNLSYKGITLDGQAIQVFVDKDKISGVKKIEPEAELPYILPPLVDLQHNGALGFAYNNMDNDAPAQFRDISSHLIRNGVGRVLATFTTAPYEVLNTAAQTLNNTLSSDSALNKLFCGIFHEGVFISPEPGWRGGHDPAYILPPDWNKLQHLNQLSGKRIKLINIAPEESGALDFIEKAVDSGIKVSVGHCCPDSSVINEAVKRGASMVTHFGNGASPTIHRFKNPFWGFLDSDKLALGLVGDGFHLPPELVRTVLRVKGQESCFMVSDANIYSGCKPGLYHRLGGCDCVIEANGFIHLPDQDILAGAWFQNNRSVEFLVNCVGLDFAEAWKMCSTTPAYLMNIHLPTLQEGEEATFVQADFENNNLIIKQSVFCGKKHLN